MPKKRRKPKSHKSKSGRNWNRIAHEFLILLIGIGMGLYAYESKIALLPAKDSVNQEVADELARERGGEQPTRQPRPGRRQQFNFLDSVFKNAKHKNPVVAGILKEFEKAPQVQKFQRNMNKFERVIQRKGHSGKTRRHVESLARGEGVDTIPKSWMEKGNRPFFYLGILIMVCSLIAKIALYTGKLDLNYMVGGRRKKRKYTDWNGIVQDITTLTLSLFIGMYTDPFLANLESTREPCSYPYGTLGVILIALCCILKLLFYFDLLDLNRRSAPKRRRG